MKRPDIEETKEQIKTNCSSMLELIEYIEHLESVLKAIDPTIKKF